MCTHRGIQASTGLVLKKRLCQSSSIFFKMKRLAAWSLAASLVITVRCAVRGGSSFYFVGLRNEFELIVGGVCAPSSALKYGSSLNPNSLAEITVGKRARVVL